MTRKINSPALPRTTALCYVRQSVTREGSDTNSPERQRMNIQTVRDKHD